MNIISLCLFQTQKRKKGPTSSTENDLTVKVDGGLPSSAVTNPNFSGSPTKSQLGARDTVCIFNSDTDTPCELGTSSLTCLVAIYRNSKM